MTYTPWQLANSAINANDVANLQKLIVDNPELIAQAAKESSFPTLLHYAANRGRFDCVKLLVESGANVNFERYGVRTVLCTAVSQGHRGIVDYLLAHGADARVGRPLISAVSLPGPLNLELTRLLVEHGALVNEYYHPYDDPKQPLIGPLTFADDPAVVDYLYSQGAKMPPNAPSESSGVEDAVIAHFSKTLGPVNQLSQQEVVPTGLPISIHVVPPTEGRNHITLFTTGMSTEPVNLTAAGDMVHAELTINLPADWPLPGSGSKRSALQWLTGKPKGAQPAGGATWPFEWLRTLARFPHDSGEPLGGAGIIIANGDPPEPLAAGLNFTSFLLLNVEEINRPDGKVVHVYQMLPLYSQERDLEIANGLPALLTALDRNNISWVVDTNRKNVGL